MFSVLRSISQKTGLAPMYSTTLAVETPVKAGTMTSSPCLSPSIATERCGAAVQEVVVIENAGFCKIGKFLFKLLYKWILHYPTSFQGFDNNIYLFITKKGFGNRDWRRRESLLFPFKRNKFPYQVADYAIEWCQPALVLDRFPI